MLSTSTPEVRLSGRENGLLVGTILVAVPPLR
jgi:hypothetical protein